MRSLALSLLALIVLFAAAPGSRGGDFPLKDGDIWVLAGDSITAQHLHSNYFEAFCYARYNKIKFGFRNAGVGGHTIPATLARFDYDIAAWKPTVVSVELGMNDQGTYAFEDFVTNMAKMVERIRAIKARPVLFSPSPLNNGTTLAHLGSNTRLHEYALALKGYAAKEKIPYADQFHDLIDLWGNNKSRETRLNTLFTIRNLAKDDKLTGVEHLRAFLAAQDKEIDQLVSLQGDAVHPGAPGQLTMAAALLKDLGAEPFVSSVAVTAAGAVDAKGCKVTNAKTGKTSVSFDRLDACLPFPIPDDARSALRLDPTILEMSQYTLKVAGLKSGAFVLKIDNAPIATLSAKDLEAGVNLTAFGSDPRSKLPNPIVAQGKAILSAVSARAALVSQWRGLSKTANVPNRLNIDNGAMRAAWDARAKLEPLARKINEAEVKIREAARPKKLHFELAAP